MYNKEGYEAATSVKGGSWGGYGNKGSSSKPNGNSYTYASGSLSTPGSVSLLNELGTEAIITPNGTITALPSHTGIIPADITKNLWSLGEVAPNLVRSIDSVLYNSINGLNPSFAGADESINIDNLTMNVNADSSFDPEAFILALKSRIALTRNTR